MIHNNRAPDHAFQLQAASPSFMRTTSPALASLIFGMLLAASSGCDRPPDLFTEAAGHAISARIEGPHTVVSEAGHALITGAFGKVTIERGRVKVDDGSWTSIPEGVPVSLEMASSRLRLKAGNVTISHSVR
jgi:hypothetical protein